MKEKIFIRQPLEKNLNDNYKKATNTLLSHKLHKKTFTKNSQ